MTTAQKHKYKTTRYNNPWDPTTSITEYFTQLNWFQVSNHGIATSDAEKKWQQEHKCGRAKCSQKTRWLRGRTNSCTADMGGAPDLLHQKMAETQKNLRWQSNRVSKKQCFLHRRQQQLKLKANCKQCCLQCCWNSTTDKLRQ
jgi:hypothetical protein